MQIVSDRGMDLSPAQLAGLNVHLVPLMLTLGGRTYRSGDDLAPEEFYRLLVRTDGFPTTSQPSSGDFAALYRRLAVDDPEILSIHISSGLSGTVNAARLGAAMVPEARVTIYDSKTLSGALGWHVETAAKAARANWPMARILEILRRVGEATDTVFTLATLKYLLHGGRINHLKGLVASLLNIKPVIGVEKAGGTYVQHGQARTMENALLRLADHVAERYSPGAALRLQILHGCNPEGATLLRERLSQLFQCSWLPSGPIAPVLGAHTGPGLVGLVFAPQAAFQGMP